MPPFRPDPQNLTVRELKAILKENNVSLPRGNKKKIVYINLYKEHLLSNEKYDILDDFQTQRQDALLEDFDARLEDSIQEIYRVRDEMIHNLSRRLALELARLPQDIRTMTVEEARKKVPHLKL